MSKLSIRSRQLGLCLHLVWLGACASGDDAPPQEPLRQQMIMFSPMYSAFGGSQTYALTPYVTAATSREEGEPVFLSSIKWQVDERFVERASFEELEYAIKLTTKRAGVTHVSLSARSVSGLEVRADSRLVISEANDDDWAVGDAHYSHGEPLSISTDTHLVETGTCGTAIDFHRYLRPDPVCSDCHGTSRSAAVVEYTPTQTAGYSDEQLIDIFAHAAKPTGFIYSSPLVTMLPQPDCGYALLHGMQVPEQAWRGLVLKLRSLPPHALEDVDPLKVAEMREAAAARQASGAGGSAAP